MPVGNGDHLLQAGFVNGQDPLFQVFHPFPVDIERHRSVSQVGKARSRHQAHIAHADHAKLLHSTSAGSWK